MGEQGPLPRDEHDQRRRAPEGSNVRTIFSTSFSTILINSHDTKLQTYRRAPSRNNPFGCSSSYSLPRSSPERARRTGASELARVSNRLPSKLPNHSTFKHERTHKK